MRDSLSDLIDRSLIYKYSLPNTDKSIPKSIHTQQNDHCFAADEGENLANIIYNGIVEYSFKEVDLTKLQVYQQRALQTKIKYNPELEETSKLQLGFYGEVLLFLILQARFGAETVISRGYFYNPAENSETKGYDTYQIVQKPGCNPELWFGEVKFYIDYTDALKSVFSNIKKALSDNYLETQILSMSERGPFNDTGSAVEEIVQAWEENPSIVISEELNNRQMSLVYPILIAFDDKNKEYDIIIKNVIDYINSRFKVNEYNITIPVQIFFILLPVSDVRNVKKQVIEWIGSNQQLV